MLLFLTFALQALAATDDLDRDGLNDQTELELLGQFLPRFYLSEGECDTAPSAFTPGSTAPKIMGRNGTIYGQAFPAAHLGEGLVELHYYHLWARDCGRSGHRLDPEHASLLIRKAGTGWRAAYWYTAAHEDTVCDVSMGRKADPSKPMNVWISAGKHASFLTLAACNSNGCGADRCRQPRQMTVSSLRNLGEPGALLPGMEWAASPLWPLRDKMASDFSPALLRQLDDAGVGPLRTRISTRGAQTTVAVSSKPVDAVQTGARRTDTALQDSAAQTKGFLQRAARGVKKALGGN